MRHRSLFVLGAAVTAGSLLMSGCGVFDAERKTVSLRDRLPKAIRDAGVIQVGSDLNYAPVDFRDANGVTIGMDPDIAEALGRVLGVKFEFHDTNGFNHVLPSLLQGKYDIAMSAITDTRERRDGQDADGRKVNEGVNFVDYFLAGIAIVVEKGNPKKIFGLNDLCGRTLAVKKSTTQYELAVRQQQACRNLGKPLKVTGQNSDVQALAEVRAGRADAQMSDFPVAAHSARTTDGGKAFELAPDQLQPAPFGIALRKEDTELRDALVRAIDTIIISGEYEKILAKWNLTNGAVQNALATGS
ncbi:ABC transporter substrate-binding protein [Peterkaempfera bronchialis]|uniref:ABC transporter substrate-binding protein n=1 Tax=Peterkaempfera bronchialis TaxID=2126346 RepID=UPI0013B460D3|nr:ABC transporter substrate-binding protein [Peterkaempfera bronchialis]